VISGSPLSAGALRNRLERHESGGVVAERGQDVEVGIREGVDERERGSDLALR
jgi:hypothetical protein